MSLPAVLPLGARPVLAVVRYLSLTDIEIEADDLRVLAARLTVRIELPDGEGPLRVTGNVAGRRHGRLQLRVISFAPGGRMRVRRYLGAHDTLDAVITSEVPAMPRSCLPPKPQDYWARSHVVVEREEQAVDTPDSASPVLLDRPIVRRKVALAPGVGRVARPVDDDPMARALSEGYAPIVIPRLVRATATSG